MSSINQAYDKYVAKEDNRIQHNNLTFIRNSRHWNSNITDQWGLLHCGIAAVRHATMYPHLWVNSFIAVNLNPTERIPFEEWCENIDAHMQSSDSFDLVLQNDNNIDKYLLLSYTWKAISTEHKTAAVYILKKNEGNAWGFDCCRNIADVVCVTSSKLHTFQPAIFIAMEDLSHLTCGYDAVYLNGNGQVADIDPHMVRVETNRKKSNDGLSMMI